MGAPRRPQIRVETAAVESERLPRPSPRSEDGPELAPQDVGEQARGDAITRRHNESWDGEGARTDEKELEIRSARRAGEDTEHGFVRGWGRRRWMECIHK